MTKWVCHNCKTKNDIKSERCEGKTCNKRQQSLDKVIGADKDD